MAGVRGHLFVFVDTHNRVAAGSRRLPRMAITSAGVKLFVVLISLPFRTPGVVTFLAVAHNLVRHLVLQVGWPLAPRKDRQRRAAARRDDIALTGAHLLPPPRTVREPRGPPPADQWMA